MDIETLLKEHLTPVKAPFELDELIKKMTLEQKIIRTWISTAQSCASCPSTPYARDLVPFNKKISVPTCNYITWNMLDATTKQTANKKVCPYQSLRFEPFKHKGRFKATIQTEPIGGYRCLKKS
jgi:hypothetical protein